MRQIYLLLDMERVDTGNEAQGRIVRVFSKQNDAISTRAVLESIPHPHRDMGYIHHFEIERWYVDDAALTLDDIRHGCIEGIKVPE